MNQHAMLANDNNPASRVCVEDVRLPFIPTAMLRVLTTQASLQPFPQHQQTAYVLQTVQWWARDGLMVLPA